MRVTTKNKLEPGFTTDWSHKSLHHTNFQNKQVAHDTQERIQ